MIKANHDPIDLSPACWIWFPSERTLPATFVQFRRRLFAREKPTRVYGCITADSRYRVTISGEFIQWGPAPCDPRTLDVDPVDLTGHIHAGANTIEIEVLFYGHGEGTWVCGKPGLIVKLNLEYADGSIDSIVSDRSWECAPDPGRPPGRPKRSYQRSLQEIQDLRKLVTQWLPAMELDAPATKPPICSSYKDYLTGISLQKPENFSLRERTIPAMVYRSVTAVEPVAHLVRWARDPNEWFDFRVPGSYELKPVEHRCVVEGGQNAVVVPQPSSPAEAYAVTYDLNGQFIGWPRVEIIAPEGTIVEIMLQEGHDPTESAWLDTHHHRWLRFICKDGHNVFDAFEYDSFRWIQLHIRDNTSECRIVSVGARVREYPFARRPEYEIGDLQIAPVIEACLNTVRLSAQETIVDGMGRERQQYSGDIGHELLAIMSVFGETTQPARFITTYSEGQTIWGYFTDAWPGADRMNRVSQRLLGLTKWGIVLDHSIQFMHDCRHYLLASGDEKTVSAVYPRLVLLLRYLEQNVEDDTGLAVDDLGIPYVWMDHTAYKTQQHKQCAYMLTVAAALENGLAPLARHFDANSDVAARSVDLASRLVAIAHRRFWCRSRRTFVVNLPWIDNESGVRHCDRSLATAVLYGYCPEGDTSESVRILEERPPEMGYTYVPNQYWRHRALIHAGRLYQILAEYRTEWATMESVVRNKTISEGWNPPPDTSAQYAHAGVVPLITLYLDVAGIRPTAPGFTRYVVQPRLADLASLSVTCPTPAGDIRFRSRFDASSRHHTVKLGSAKSGDGTLVVPAQALVEFHGKTVHGVPDSDGRVRFAMPRDCEISITLPSDDATAAPNEIGEY